MPLFQGNKRIFGPQNGQRKRSLHLCLLGYGRYVVENSGIFPMSLAQNLVLRLASVCESFVTSPQ